MYDAGTIGDTTRIWTDGMPGKKTPLFEPLLYKLIILPRQARDNRRESTQKESGVFLQTGPSSLPLPTSPD